MRTRRSFSLVAWALVAGLGWTCASPPQPIEPESAEPMAQVGGPQPVASPAGTGAMAPHLAVVGNDLLLSWLEPGDEGHRFLVARRHEGEWSAPSLIAAGDDFFANWADVPKIGVAGDGTLWAHWLAKTGDDTYAYGIFLARSTDGGTTWEPMGTLHDDASPTEHGFVAYTAEDSALRAVWLDGREMEHGGAMTVRSARLDEAVGPETVIDDRACECCPTAVTATSQGALVLYRDRSLEEVRNIGLSRFIDGSWSPPTSLHDDGWTIAGCPVNGPAVDAAGDELAAAWFTMIDEEPRVQLVFSNDAGVTFSAPQLVDGQGPLGRVGLALDSDASAWVSWLGVRADLAEVRVARYTSSGPNEEWTVAATGTSRASGIPRLARAGDALYIAWVEAVDDQPSVLRLATWPAGRAGSGLS